MLSSMVCGFAVQIVVVPGSDDEVRLQASNQGGDFGFVRTRRITIVADNHEALSERRDTTFGRHTRRPGSAEVAGTGTTEVSGTGTAGTCLTRAGSSSKLGRARWSEQAIDSSPAPPNTSRPSGRLACQRFAIRERCSQLRASGCNSRTPPFRPECGTRSNRRQLRSRDLQGK